MSGKTQTIGDFTVFRPSQILATNEKSKSQISPIVWDGRAQIWRIGRVSIFPMCPRFLRWRPSFSLTQLPSENDTKKNNKGLLPSLTQIIHNFE